jgi:hypothetical protein
MNDKKTFLLRRSLNNHFLHWLYST